MALLLSGYDTIRIVSGYDIIKKWDSHDRTHHNSIRISQYRVWSKNCDYAI